MSKDDRTDRFRPVFEPEDIFDRFVRNANASTEERIGRDDEPTGRVPTERASTKRAGRGGPPSWDHAITVQGPRPLDPERAPRVSASPEIDAPVLRAPGSSPPELDDGTRPDAPMPLAMARAFTDEEDDASGGHDEDLTVPRASPLDHASDDPSDEEDDDEPLTVPRASPLDPRGAALTESGQRILLLTRVKRPGSQPPPSDDPATPAVDPDPPSEERAWESAVGPRGEHTQRLEAMKVVPDVEAAATRGEETYVGEGIEDGQMPTRQLDQILSDMGVLLRYGHATQVRGRLEELRRTYPEDLLLLRRIAEFLVEHHQVDAAMETLFALAGGLFERRNVEGMRQALEQVLVLDPDNARAYRLLGLLEKRPHGSARD